MLRLSILALPFVVHAAACGPDPYTCADAIPTTVTITAPAPFTVDTTKPAEPAAVDLDATFQVTCNLQAETLEIASGALIDFNTGEKFLDIPLRFPSGAETTPSCDADKVGAAFKYDVVADVANGELAPHCGKANLAILAVIKRSGCAATDPATRESKALVSLACSP